MARRRIKKFSRRTRSQYKKSRAPLVLSIIAFLLLSIIISIAVGISLGKRADGAKTSRKFEFHKTEYTSNGKKVSVRKAYNFPYGARVTDYAAQDISELSVCIRHEDGNLDYFFEAGEAVPIYPMNTEIKFSRLCADADSAGVKVCAYMYITSFSSENKYIRDTLKSYETALIAEAASAGADDILLLGLDITEDNLAEAEDFIARAANAANGTPLGVAVGEDILRSSENGGYIGARIKSACDYLALDLTYMTLADGESAGEDENGEPLPSELEKTVENCEYYIETYPTRLLFSNEYSKLYVYAKELGVIDFQIVGK